MMMKKNVKQIEDAESEKALVAFRKLKALVLSVARLDTRLQRVLTN